MVKRKAEGGHRGGKSPARPPPTRQPPPPPAQDDSDDSDICEIVSPPHPSSNNAPRLPPAAGPPMAAQKPLAPGSSHAILHSHAQSSAGLLPMMSGMAAGFGLPQGAGFGYQQQLARFQGSGTLNPFHYAPPHLLPPPGGLHGGYFPGSILPPAAGASSGGASSEARQLGKFGVDEILNIFSIFGEGSGCMHVQESR